MATEVKSQNLSDTGNTFSKRVSSALFGVKSAPISHPVQTLSSPKGTNACSVAQRVQFFVTPRTAAHQAPLSVEFSRQEYWSGLPCTPPGDLLDPGTEPISPVSPALAEGFFITQPSGNPSSKGI